MDEDWRESTIKKEALDYHEAEPKGKIKVVPTKPHSTSHELSLAYSPGVKLIPVLKLLKTLMMLTDILRKEIWLQLSQMALQYLVWVISEPLPQSRLWKARACC